MNGQGFVGMMPPPGQYTRSTEGGKDELGITRSWALNLLVLRWLVLLSFAWEIWALGPLSLGVILPVYALLIIVKSDDYQDRWLWPCFVIVILTVAYFAFYAEVLWSDWPTLFGWRPDEHRPIEHWMAFVTPVPVAWTVARLFDFRNSYEITDKNAPGTIKAREPHGGAVGPDNIYGDNGLTVEDEPEQPAAQPARQPLVIITEHRGDNGKLRSSERQELSEQLEAKMPEIARYAIGLQTPFSEPQMAGRGKPLSKTSFSTIRDELLALGALEWKDPELRTVRWTIKGLDWCRTFNGSRPTPP